MWRGESRFLAPLGNDKVSGMAIKKSAIEEFRPEWLKGFWVAQSLQRAATKSPDPDHALQRLTCV
jgi:hypothetical protein